MTLRISPQMNLRRNALFKLVYKHKLQLAHAYASQNERRVLKAKLSLIRSLRELHGSPELGPTPTFDWGLRLTLLFKFNIDPALPYAYASTCTTYWSAIIALEESLPYVHPDKQAWSHSGHHKSACPKPPPHNSSPDPIPEALLDPLPELRGMDLVRG